MEQFVSRASLAWNCPIRPAASQTNSSSGEGFCRFTDLKVALPCPSI
jgi:hypothetical protein